jgi:hypothetical protein
MSLRARSYSAVPKSFGVLRLFLFLDRWIIPKTFFLVILFLSMTIGFLIFFWQHPFFQVALIISVIGLVLSLYFTIQFYGILPKTRAPNNSLSIQAKLRAIVDGEWIVWGRFSANRGPGDYYGLTTAIRVTVSNGRIIQIGEEQATPPGNEEEGELQKVRAR